MGYRVDEAEIDLSDPAEEADLLAAAAAAQGDSFTEMTVPTRPRRPELGFLSFEEIEDRRDQILVAAVSKNPAVSIDIG